MEKTIPSQSGQPLPTPAPPLHNTSSGERPVRGRGRNRTSSILAASTSSASEASGAGGDADQQKPRDKKRPYFSAAEKRSEAYRRVTDTNTWNPPPSFYRLLQENHSFDPWRVLIICILLNVTTGNQVKQVLPDLFLLCPNAEAMSKIDEKEVEKIIRPLGLQKRRSKMLKRFSREYLKDDWTYVTQLHGIGKYAADAYAIFCTGKMKEITPRDNKLVEYWKLFCGE